MSSNFVNATNEHIIKFIKLIVNYKKLSALAVIQLTEINCNMITDTFLVTCYKVQFLWNRK